MKLFLTKAILVFLVVIGGIFIKNIDFLKQIYEAYHYDTFNVFHWKNIRFTIAEPNKNFVKTQYIIHNPKKFNAFIFGSSRVGLLPKDALPKSMNDSELKWYNMTYSVGTPNDHLMTLQTFLKANVKIKAVLIGFDEIAMWRSAEVQKIDLVRAPFQLYKNKFEFYLPYLQLKTDESIKKQIEEYVEENHIAKKEVFYEYGWDGGKTADYSLTENPDMERYNIGGGAYSQKDSYKDLEAIVNLCMENNIKTILFTNPLYQNLYKTSVNGGYFDFLRKVAQNCEFYNFSSLNNYTKNPAYYFDWSHYRQPLALLIEKMIFGTEEEKAQIRKDAGDELWGIKVNAENIDFVIQKLQEQFEI